MKLKIKKLHPDAVIPKYQTPGAAGFDFHALDYTIVPAGKTVLIRTGLSVAVEPGYELQVRPRSGTSLKTTLLIANSPGTVDSDYRGEVCIIVRNNAFPNEIETFENSLSSPVPKHIFEVRGSDLIIQKGDRIAQGVIAQVFQAEMEEVTELDETTRGSGGFGSTGQ